MGFDVASLWKAPLVNPINNKARSVPFFNPINVYGRVLFFSWFGFMIAFWSWYAFPPLLTDVIAKDVGMKKDDVLNSNIVGLLATLLVRLIAGPSCDKYGPRKTFAGLLLAGAIPTFCAGGATNKSGIMALRFFIGILGGTFVPCQVWTTQFFDKPVVGTANAVTAGLGNAGGGITYFVMPAIFNSLVQNQGLTPHVSWRVSFVVPGILIVSTAVLMLLLCPDTPTGKWSERGNAVDSNLRNHNLPATAAIPGELSAEKTPAQQQESTSSSPSREEKKGLDDDDHKAKDGEAALSTDQMLDTARGEVVVPPTTREALRVFTSPQTFVTAAAYFCSFGAELAINSILGTFYGKQFKLSTQESGNWAAMFGLLNVAFRPLGGYVADLGYRYVPGPPGAGGSVWAKKALLHGYALMTGLFLILIGKVNTKSPSTLYGLVAGMAFFLESGNGINYALVPHVHPHANGIISGITGASGNLGGIVFAIVFRYNQNDTHKAFWIIGVMTIALNAAVAWIRPVPKGQVGGR